MIARSTGQHRGSPRPPAPAARGGARARGTSSPGSCSSRKRLGRAAAAQAAQAALAVLGREVGQGGAPAGAQCAGRGGRALAVALERRDELVESLRRRHRGDHHDLGVGSRARARRPEVAARALRDRAEVGLGHHEQVGDLHDPRLEELEHVARAGLDDDGDGVGDVGHLGLGLAHADGLDHHDVEGRGQRLRGRAGRGREPAQPFAGGGGADEHAAVARLARGCGRGRRAARRPSGARWGRRRARPPCARPAATRPRARRAATTCRRRAGRSRRPRSPAPRRRARRGRPRAAARPRPRARRACAARPG